MRRPVRGRARRGHPGCHRAGDDGFVLLESILSITLITVIMAALTSLFLTVIRVDSEQRARQAAVQVATSTMSYVRSLPTSDLLTGRAASAVDAQWAAAPAGVLPYLGAMEKATGPGTSVLPLTLAPTVVHGITYTVDVYLGWCQTTSLVGQAACLLPAVGSVLHDQLRAVVAVSWPDKHCPPRGSSDPTPTCSYVTATLVSTLSDPVFSLNQAPVALPTIALPSFAGYAVGDTVDLQMAVTAGTGVPVFTWLTVAGTWPSGVSMDSTGHVTGTIKATSLLPVTVSVTDGFVRTAATVFTWTVLPALTATGPVSRDDTLAAPVATLTLGASGGAGAPYTWSDPQGTLPPGLALDPGTGRVTGTPTAGATTVYPTTYAVSLTVADTSGTRKASVTFPWTIRYSPLAATPVTPRSEYVGRALTPLQLAATGGTGTATWTSTTLPPGLALSPAGLVTGTPTTLGTTAVTFTAADGRTSSSTTVTWTVSGAAVTSPGDLSSDHGAPVRIALTSVCPVGPCTYTLAGAPSGVSVDGTGLMTGTVGGTVKTYSGVTVTVRDKNGVTATSAPFSWTVGSAAGISATWPVVVSRGDSPDQPIAYSCQPFILGGCTVTVTGAPPGVGLSTTPGDTGTVHGPISVWQGSGYLYLSGTVSGLAPSGSSTVRLSITGFLYSASDSGTWTVR